VNLVCWGCYWLSFSITHNKQHSQWHHIYHRKSIQLKQKDSKHNMQDNRVEIRTGRTTIHTMNTEWRHNSNNEDISLYCSQRQS
jgi:hypothetical protein